MIALRSFSTMLILAKKEPFGEEEIASAKSFARRHRFDLVHYPGIRRAEANRFNVLRDDRYYNSFARLLGNEHRLYDGYEYDVRPPRDDRPFFFHFFKWAQTPTVLALLGKTWQPFGGSGYLIVLALLVVVTLLALALVLLPALVIRSRGARGGSGGWRPMTYFAALGFGFLFVEVALIQRFIVFLEHSSQAFAIVLFGLLVFSGAGSALSGRLRWRPAVALLAGVIAVYPLILSKTFGAFVGGPLGVRLVVTLVLLAPLGFLMGVPFPRGLQALGDAETSRRALAWGVNGFTSVVGAVLAAMISLSWGFTAVFGGAALAYLLASGAVWARD